MQYKTYETDSTIDLEQELNFQAKQGWTLVNVIWNREKDFYVAIMKR